MANYILALDLRNRDRNSLPRMNHPGLYRLFASEGAIHQLLDSDYLCEGENGRYMFYHDIFLANRDRKKRHSGSLIPSIGHDEFEEIPYGEKYYCIYVGIATERSLYDRVVGDHINGAVTLRNYTSMIGYGGLSTLRQSISSLLAGDWSDNDATDDFIDGLVVEYTAKQCEMGCDEAKACAEGLKAEESAQIHDHLVLLNIKENENTLLNNPFFYDAGYLDRLTQLRRASQIVGMIKCIYNDENSSSFPNMPTIELVGHRFVHRSMVYDDDHIVLF